MFANLCRLLRDKLQLSGGKWTPEVDTSLKESRATRLIPGEPRRYLAEIAEQGRGINSGIGKEAEAADRAQAMWQALHEVDDGKLPKALDLFDPARSARETRRPIAACSCCASAIRMR